MKLPTPLGFPALTFGLLLTASTALSQTVTFDQIDTNRDGILNEAELLAALGSSSLLSFDRDGSGLSRDELRAAADEGEEDDEFNEVEDEADELNEGEDEADELNEGDDEINEVEDED